MDIVATRAFFTLLSLSYVLEEGLPCIITLVFAGVVARPCVTKGQTGTKQWCRGLGRQGDTLPCRFVNTTQVEMSVSKVQKYNKKYNDKRIHQGDFLI